MLQEFRKKIEEYTTINDRNWQVIERNCKVRNIKRKESLVKHSEKNQNLFFIARGSFVISLISETGESKTVWFFLDELFDIMGCFDSIFLDEPTKYEITALEDSTVIEFSYKNVESWIESNPSLCEFVRKDALNNLVFLFEIRNHISSYTPTQLIQYLKDKFPIILERVPDKDIAELMGITPEWYSKMKRKLKDLN